MCLIETSEMETVFLLIIVSGINFATNGPSKQTNPTVRFSDFLNISRFPNGTGRFSIPGEMCNHDSDSSLYNYFTNKSESDNETESITIGFLGAYGSAQMMLGALPLAVEAINENSDLLPGKRLNFVAGDIGSGLARSTSSLASQAIKFMTKMRDIGTLAFIGPDDTCYSEALVAAAWNIPMISYVTCEVVNGIKKQEWDMSYEIVPMYQKL